jgi:GNAT superfamily N-acetyltransferase
MKTRVDFRPFCRNSYLVYVLRGPQGSPSFQTAGLTWVTADATNIDFLFRHDRHLRNRFQGFISAGNRGLFCIDRGEWVGYAWMTTVRKAAPPHLPISVPTSAAWVFHCRTRASHQGRGIYKNSLTRFAEEAEALGLDLYIDTQPDNLPSRRAIVQVGFAALGVVQVCSIRFPGWQLWAKATWNRAHPHPPMSFHESAVPTAVIGAIPSGLSAK